MSIDVKPFKTIEEQICLLTERGLLFSNIEEAKKFLTYNNYYRVSGYSLTLRKDDVFYETATFENIIHIYRFDKEFRHYLLTVLESIEVEIKSVIAYEHALKYNPLGYLDRNNFNNKKDKKGNDIFKQVMEKAQKQQNHNIYHEAFLKHHRDKREGIIPFWVYIELFTISDISKLYTILDENLQKIIAHKFNFEHKNNNIHLANSLLNMAILRNICAHGGRLFNRKFITKASITKNGYKMLIIDKDGIPDNTKLFGYILVIKRLSNSDEVNEFLNKLKLLHKKYSFVDMKHYGFPDNWVDIL